MKIKAKQYASALLELVKDAKEKDVEKYVTEFVKTLIKNNHTSQIDKILDYFNIFWNIEKKEVEAEVCSIKTLDKDSVKQINNYVIKKLNIKKVNLIEKQDKKILGGIILKYDDIILDCSVRNKLEDIKKEL